MNSKWQNCLGSHQLRTSHMCLRGTTYYEMPMQTTCREHELGSAKWKKHSYNMEDAKGKQILEGKDSKLGTEASWVGFWWSKQGNNHQTTTHFKSVWAFSLPLIIAPAVSTSSPSCDWSCCEIEPPPLLCLSVEAWGPSDSFPGAPLCSTQTPTSTQCCSCSNFSQDAGLGSADLDMSTLSQATWALLSEMLAKNEENYSDDSKRVERVLFALMI